MNAIEIPFQIGQTYWLPVSHGKSVEIVCPVCAGHRAITVILGDGENVRVPCDGCGIGYEGPRGYVNEHRYEPGAECVSITGIDSMREGKWRVSLDIGYSVDFESLCPSKDEALVRSAVLVAEAWERVMASHCRKRDQKQTGWTVRYHRMQISELKKKIEWHESKVQAPK